MNIGITLVFKEKETQVIKGILKSLVLDVDLKNIDKFVIDSAKKIEKYYNYRYLGINDIFVVSKKGIKEASLLGRTTFYDLDSTAKSKSLVSNDFSFNDATDHNTFNCSLIYLCESNNEKFTISVISVVNSTVENVIDKVISISKQPSFLNEIKNNSIHEINKLNFIGIEDICDVDLRFNIFQSFYSDFDTIEILEQEVLSKEEINEIIEDIEDIE